MAPFAEALHPGRVSASDLAAPLYVAWQITNECNLRCLHCIEESGPGRAFPDELDAAQAFSILDQLVEAQVPYVSFSGGEPMLHPGFFEMATRLCAGGTALKVETNGHFLSHENCLRLKESGVRTVQLSLDGATQETYSKLRPGGRLELALEGAECLRAASVALEVNFCPTRSNIEDVERVVDMAYEAGAVSFYTGKTMYTGNAVKAWTQLTPTDEQYSRFFAALRRKAREYQGRMRVRYHEMGLLEELKYRLTEPAALFIILPNGVVKLINALPFVCGDLRRAPLKDVWANFQRAWKDPRVASFVGELEAEPERVSELHRWVTL